jgi:hypothetical protein
MDSKNWCGKVDGLFEVTVLRLKMLWREIHAFRPTPPSPSARLNR